MAELTRDALTRAGLLTTCREVIDGPVGVVTPGVCGNPAEFILWGKLFPKEALGPRCYDHAMEYVGEQALAMAAVVDLRPLLRALQEDEDAAAAAEAAPAPPSGKRERIEFMADAIAAGVVPAVDYCAEGERVHLEYGWAHVVLYGSVGFGETQRSYPAHVVAQVIHGDRE